MEEKIPRLDNEPDNAYLAFTHYARMSPPRMSRERLTAFLKAVIKDNPPTERTIYRWIKKYKWNERVHEFDLRTLDARTQAFAFIAAKQEEEIVSDHAALRRRLIIASHAFSTLGEELLVKARAALHSIPTGTPPSSSISTAIRTGVYIMDKAHEAAAQVLGLDEFLKHYEKVTIPGNEDDL